MKDFIATPRQSTALKYLNDRITRFLLFGGGAGGGKAQPLGSLLLTPNGFKRMGDIKLNDDILTPENKKSKVIAIHPQGVQDIYELVFIDGSKIKITDGHLFDCWIARRKNRSRSIKNTKEIINLFYQGKNIIFPLSSPLDFGKDFTKISPYIIGALLGDGGLTTSSMNISSADQQIITKINKELTFNNFISKGKAKYRYNIKCGLHNKKGYPINLLKDELNKLGMMRKGSSDKRVSKELLNSSLKTRLELIKGLMDTDGTTDKRGHCSFISKSKGLSEDLQYLIRSIGGKATLTSKKKFCMYKGKKREGIYWELYINTNNNRDLFYLDRKLNRCRKYNGGYELGKRLIAVNKLKPELAQCITIADKKGLYISDDFTVTHNSYLGVAWVVGMCLAYPEVRYFIGRNELKRLMMTTYITFLKFCKAQNLKNGIDWWFDGKYHVIHFYNGSTIDLLDVAYMPSDPLYERFGSSEYTSGWLEEIGEQNFGAYDTLKSRINRHMNKEYNIFPKLLMTCNPKRHWAYYEYYKPWKEGTLPKNRVFLQSLYLDNPHTADSYGESLSEIKDKAKKARLMFGDWEYDDDPALLVDRDKMDDMFTSAPRINKARYITCDPARFGDDLTVVLLWQGFHIMGAWKYPKTSVKEVRDILYQLASKWQVPTSNIQVDEDGVGGGVKDFYPGIRGFVNNSSPIRTEQEKKDKLQNYRNLKAQCYYRLADYINLGRISIFKEISPEIKEGLVEDLCHLKSKDPDNDLVQDIVGKDEIKKSLGRSPDYSDAVMIRMQFELNKSGFSVRAG